MAASKLITCVCLGCSVTFTVYPSAFKRGEGRYCTKACFQKNRPIIPFADRFWSHVEKSEGCWLWTGHRTNKGYGAFNVDKTRPIPAHRVAYELTYGVILPGVWCLHQCDNPPCCNPEHLFLGTPGDNSRDMTSKGRNGAHTHPERWKRGLEHHTHLRPETLKRGTENHNAKVTDDVVRDIRHLRNIEKWELKRLAAHFDMSISQVQKIAARTVWKHVD